LKKNSPNTQYVKKNLKISKKKSFQLNTGEEEFLKERKKYFQLNTVKKYF
jgi:hypothetical protein